MAVPFSASGWCCQDHQQPWLWPSSLYQVGELKAVWRAWVTRPPYFSSKPGSKALTCWKSTAQWTWINIIGAHPYIEACTDANFQAINCFSLAYSDVYFDIRGDYQLYYMYLAHLSVEHISNTTGTLRIGAAILEVHQVLFRLQSQQPHDLHTCGGLYVQ